MNKKQKMVFGLFFGIIIVFAAVIVFVESNPKSSTNISASTNIVSEISKLKNSVANPGKVSVKKNPKAVSIPQAPFRKKWGVFAGGQPQDLTSFESSLGLKANLSAIFLDMGSQDPFPAPVQVGDVKSQSKTLVIFWEQYENATVDDITAGNFDSYISQFALSAKNYGAPIILIPLQEMNGNWDPWDGTVGNNTPAKIISEWRHIHDLFSGAGNVKFGWAVNNDSVPDTSANTIASYYPGDSYVDYVGVDGFNFGDPWQSYSEVFSSALAQLKVYNKPIYIFSMASAEGPQKAAWIKDALSQIKSDPKIAGFVWFNINKEKNWLVNSDAASFQAFKSGLQKYQ